MTNGAFGIVALLPGRLKVDNGRHDPYSSAVSEKRLREIRESNIFNSAY